MPLRVSNLRIPVEHPEDKLPTLIAKAVGCAPTDLGPWKILRKSLDLRDKHALRFVYNCQVEWPDGSPPRQRSSFPVAKVEEFEEPRFEMPTPGKNPLPLRPVVIGSGPGGLLCALQLARLGYKPLVLERGTPVHERIKHVETFDKGGEFYPESNYLFGEGGAGTFSDGKLTCRMTGPDVTRVLEIFAECKGQQPGKPSIITYHRPHLGSNRLPAVVKAMRREIQNHGGEVRFHTKAEDLIFNENGLQGVGTSGGFIPACVVVLAIGHSARDTYSMLAKRNISMAAKAFQFGVRVEHPQSVINRTQFGHNHTRYEQILGNADYSLVAHGEQDLFTFCMCAGGYVIPSVSQEGYFCTNGMSLSKRDSPYANSGLVTTVPITAFPGTDVLAGVRLQEEYEKKAFELGRGEYRSPAQTARSFLQGNSPTSTPRSSYPRGVVACDLREVLPPVVAKAVESGLPKMDYAWRGHFLPEAVLVGPEARGSSPIRINRDDFSRESPTVAGLYPVGEGAGYAGGIISAAVDGLRTAKAIVAKYAPVG